MTDKTTINPQSPTIFTWMGFSSMLFLVGAFYSWITPPYNNKVKLNQQKPYELIVRDLNKNEKSEKYYEFNGRNFFLEIDGKNLESSLMKGK